MGHPVELETWLVVCPEGRPVAQLTWMEGVARASFRSQGHESAQKIRHNPAWFRYDGQGRRYHRR